MARPTKQGIDYFNVDVNWDEKVEMLIAEKGAIALSILITIWQLVYQNEGYYIGADDDLNLLIKRRLMLNIEEIDDVIKTAIRRGIFDQEKNNSYGILTSKAIQKRYFDAAKKKKKIAVDNRYLIEGVPAGTNTVLLKKKEENKVLSVSLKTCKTMCDKYSSLDVIGLTLEFAAFQCEHSSKMTQTELDDHFAKYCAKEVVNVTKPVNPKIEEFKLLHKQHSKALTMNPSILASFNKWAESEVPLSVVEDAYRETAGTRSEATRWSWIVEKVEDKKKPETQQTVKKSPMRRAMDEMNKQLEGGSHGLG